MPEAGCPTPGSHPNWGPKLNDTLQLLLLGTPPRAPEIPRASLAGPRATPPLLSCHRAGCGTFHVASGSRTPLPPNTRDGPQPPGNQQ